MTSAASSRWAIEHREGEAAGDDGLLALEPTPAEIAAAAPALAAFYNDPHNRRMMANTVTMTPAEVVTSFDELRAQGGRPFLLFSGERLLGDGDLRHLDAGARAGEAAILIGDRTIQGRGLGTRFAAMLHAFGFEVLGLGRIYASILPDNAASVRLFTKLGHQPDGSAAARAFADEPGDVTLSVTAARFEAAARALRDGVRLYPRGPGA